MSARTFVILGVCVAFLCGRPGAFLATLLATVILFSTIKAAQDSPVPTEDWLATENSQMGEVKPYEEVRSDSASSLEDVRNSDTIGEPCPDDVAAAIGEQKDCFVQVAESSEVDNETLVDTLATHQIASSESSVLCAPTTQIGLLVTAEFEEASKRCREKVEHISKECRKGNRKFRLIVCFLRHG